MLYSLLWLKCWFLAKILFRLRFEGRENIPTSGALVVVSNHKSYIDPIIVALAFRRRVYFMAKAELFDVPILSQLCRALGAFPVQRGEPDRKALRRALEVLDEGGVLGLFPEGKRIRRPGLAEFEAGAGLIAVKSGAPVLPIGVRGSGRVMPEGSRILHFPQITVKVGRPFALAGVEEAVPRREQVTHATERLASEISRLTSD